VSTHDGPAWTAGQLARELGISESTLRTWHRRYGLSPLGSEPGHYRRYLPQDVARLRRMVELVNQGMLASEAARVVQDGGSAPGAAGADLAALLEAARALDTGRCGSLLDGLITRRGVVEAWEQVCVPALLGVDAHPRDDLSLTAAEHALSWSLHGALHRLPRLPADPGAAPVLLACVAGEQHTLPLAALAAALAERRIPARMLGAATPAASLERAVRETRPGAVVLWAQRPQSAAPDVLRALSRYPVHRVAAGPGWGNSPAPGVTLVTTLRGALAALSQS
jgi:MerR family transcriptional regulator, light-induced transcriptional regulator